jgi:serine O-acetyltransferase
MSVSATEPDWSRERPRRWWDPSRRLLRAIRRYQAARGPFAPLVRRYWVLQHRFWSVVTQADIPLDTVIGGGLKLPHPNGIVIHPDTRIGPNCLIFQQVTLGTRPEQPVAPRIGGHVDIGAGARILGNVTIGDHARIGANAVVLCDIPAGATAVGIPARILSQASETA